MRPSIAPLALIFGLGCGGATGGGDPPSADSATSHATGEHAAHGAGHGHAHGDGHGHAHGDGHGQAHGDGHGQAHGDGHHGFDDPEEWAARWEGPERDAWQQPEQVIAWMDIEPGMLVADIGTGTGYFLPHLSEAVGPEGQVSCLDVEAAMVAYVNDRITESGVTNARAALIAYDDPGLDQPVDRILMVNTWHHVENRVAYAEKLLAGLSSEGTVTIVEYNADAQPGPPLEMRLSPAQVMSEFEEAGFAAEVVGELPRQYVVRARLAER